MGREQVTAADKGLIALDLMTGLMREMIRAGRLDAEAIERVFNGAEEDAAGEPTISRFLVEIREGLVAKLPAADQGAETDEQTEGSDQ